MKLTSYPEQEFNTKIDTEFLNQAISKYVETAKIPKSVPLSQLTKNIKRYTEESSKILQLIEKSEKLTNEIMSKNTQMNYECERMINKIRSTI